MFNTRDRATDEKITEPSWVVTDLMALVRSGAGEGTRLISDDSRSHVIDLVRSDRDGLRIEIVTMLGHARKEWWTFDKFERFLRAGFLAIYGGETYHQWVENSRPQPPKPETVVGFSRFFRDVGFSWPFLPLSSRPAGGDDLLDIPEDGSEWELHFVAADGDAIVHLWGLVSADGTEVFMPTDGDAPKGRRGFADIFGLVTTMGYERLKFVPPSSATPTRSPTL